MIFFNMTSDFLKFQSSELIEFCPCLVPSVRFQTKFIEDEMGQNFKAEYYHLDNKFLLGGFHSYNSCC